MSKLGIFYIFYTFRKVILNVFDTNIKINTLAIINANILDYKKYDND